MRTEGVLGFTRRRVPRRSLKKLALQVRCDPANLAKVLDRKPRPEASLAQAAERPTGFLGAKLDRSPAPD